MHSLHMNTNKKEDSYISLFFSSNCTLQYTLKPTNSIYQYFLQEFLHKNPSAKSMCHPKLVLFPHALVLYVSSKYILHNKLCQK